jgi:hypothetical protein
MRFILIAFVVCFFGVIALSILGFFMSLFSSNKKLKVAEGKRMATESAERSYASRLKDAVNGVFEKVQLTPIDLDNSVSVTQYGNDVLKNIGELANYMYMLSQNPILETTSGIITELQSKRGYFSDEDFAKYNFIAHYTKDRLMKNVTSIEINSKKYEEVFKDFDKVIKHAETTVANFKPVNTSDVYENEIQNNKKSNINLLKNKILNLKKSKLYHQQSLAQLKVMRGLNNNLIVEFDNIILQMLPLIKNNASIESLKDLHIENLSKYIDKIRKINEVKS